MEDSRQPNERVALSLIIPVYNEAESLPVLFEELEGLTASLGQSAEIIFVDDGSTDGSTEWLTAHCAGSPFSNADCVTAIQRRNFGKSAALQVGFALAQGDVVVTMDGDLQDDPAELPKLLEVLDSGYDVVTGWRQNRNANDTRSKIIASRIANAITRLLSGLPVNDLNSGFKAYRADVLEHIPLHSDLHRYVPVLAHYWGYKVTEVRVNHRPRPYGRSKYGASRFLRSAFDLVTVLFLGRFRSRPLHLFGGFGLLIGGLGVVIGLYLSVLWLQGNRPIGDRPLLLLAVLLTIVGIQLFSIGLVADLLVTMNRRNENPLSTLRRIISAKPPHAQHVQGLSQHYPPRSKTLASGTPRSQR